MAESVALVPAEVAVSLGVLHADHASEVVNVATEVANALAGVIESRKLYNNISGRRYVRCEGWTTLAAMLGFVPREVAVTRLESGTYQAIVELVRLSDGSAPIRASAECGMDEPTWASRPDYARRSMAVTRATSKACRLAFSWVMALSGYEVTPAEEIPHDTDGVVLRPEQTGEPPKMRRGKVMPFGNHKGMLLAEMETADLQSALKWCKEKDANKFKDLIADLSSELAKRASREPGED